MSATAVPTNITVEAVLAAVEELWPLSGAEQWDAPGLQIGSRRQEVSHILLSVDVTPDIVAEAESQGADVILAHHPMLLRGITNVTFESDRGELVRRVLGAGVSVIAAHTNADVVAHGVSDALARLLNLGDVRPLVPGVIPGTGLGRRGSLSEPMSLRGLAQKLAVSLPSTVSGIRVSGPQDAVVSTVSLCGGAGDSLLAVDAVLNSDVYITSDLRHHPTLDASVRAEMGHGPWLIDISHWASESLWLEVARVQLSEKLPGCLISVSQHQTDPWTFRVE